MVLSTQIKFYRCIKMLFEDLLPHKFQKLLQTNPRKHKHAETEVIILQVSPWNAN
jgi:hypothetical protein